MSHILALTLSEVGNDCLFFLAKLPGEFDHLLVFSMYGP